jgi:hypothetical protein
MLMHATIVWSLIAQASLLENVGLQSPHDIDSIVALMIWILHSRFEPSLFTEQLTIVV